jgi:hypothetical protein
VLICHLENDRQAAEVDDKSGSGDDFAPDDEDMDADDEDTGHAKKTKGAKVTRADIAAARVVGDAAGTPQTTGDKKRKTPPAGAEKYFSICFASSVTDRV